MTNKAKSKPLLSKSTCLLLLVITIVICAGASFLALHIDREQFHKIQKSLGIEVVKPNRVSSLKQTTLEVGNQTFAIMLPFNLPENKLFRLDEDIKYYIKCSNAYAAENDDISIEIYAITFKSELLPSKWTPNLENMAETSTSDLKNITALKNLKTTYEKRNVSGNPAIQLRSTYSIDKKDYVQRTLHIAKGYTTWSIKLTYEDQDSLDELATRIIYSSLFK